MAPPMELTIGPPALAPPTTPIPFIVEWPPMGPTMWLVEASQGAAQELAAAGTGWLPPVPTVIASRTAPVIVSHGAGLELLRMDA
mmetsp:Transcript_125170/g.365559  ORF Transcript_125170/g.365559 Transcript_125170/m.365559 type:complete len:85 (-) Transcript_125170:1195-1449(-)